MAILACYLFAIFIALYGWYKIKHFNTEIINKSVNISLLIPFCNEEKNLPALVESLRKQTVLPYEIIFIDDHSSDSSVDIVNEAKFYLPGIILLQNAENSKGKKAALMTGLEIAKGDWIIQTDADCILPEKWLESYIHEINSFPYAVFISGPVKYLPGKSFFSWFFELDFMSLVFTGAGLAGAGRPAFCNGANMAYKRNTVLELPDPYFASTPSGDDVFLIHQLAKKYKNGIAFLKSKNAIVKTNPPSSLRRFFLQRARWGSKTKYYKSGFAKFLALSVFFVNFVFLLFWTLAILGTTPWIYAFIYTIIKIIADTFILIPSLKFFGRNKLMPLIIPALVMYPFYNVIAALASLFIRAEWKK